MKKIYSFDLFDTLVARGVNHPKDIFTIVGAVSKVNYRFIFFKLFSFRKIRVFSEKLARFISKKEDIDIYEIYKIINFFIENSKDILEVEIKLELHLIKPKLENIEILNTLKKQGEFLCITSDMYLPFDVIKKILNENNIFVNKVYVSSSVGLTKSSGNLFKFIADDLDVDLSQIVHYGDNIESDVNVPNALGCKGIHVGHAFHKNSNGFLDCFKSPIQNDVYYKIGYELCGKIAYVFSNNIYNNIKDNQNNLIFGARDSYLFKFSFDLFFNNEINYKTYYTRISRSLVYLPQCYYSNSYDVLFYETMSCENFFLRLDLECPSEFKGKSAWKYKNDIILFLRNNEEFNIQLKYKSSNAKTFLKENGFNRDLYFIDLGWKGSIQNSLDLIFNNELNVKGLYFGTTVNDKFKRGFAFNNKKPFRNYFYITQSLALFEFLFTEPEQSLGAVKVVHNKISPIFTNDENLNQINNRRKIELGAKQFLLDFFEFNNMFEINNEDINRSIQPLIYNHTMVVKDEIVSAFLNSSHSIGFNGSLKANLIEYSKLSIKGYLTAPWKAYFMHDLRKKSKIKYFIYRVFFHNVFFFIFYEYIKFFFRKIRALIYG
ncbi:hypothetical protein A7P53_15365 [Acinetobacter defluvii]|uniref:hypothetical protein n=1 Tax=Acinetobacter defluvii TaxID=1871111 RepID=UPI00148F5B15|nr:hypothetical protein [Acinetobacter defluvii]NNP73961.1 hypothetical protein [Acinetobacter defluvii]